MLCKLDIKKEYDHTIHLSQQISDIFCIIATDYSAIATGVEYDEHREKECFKSNDPNANSPSTKELVKTFSIHHYPVRMYCFEKYLDLSEDDNAHFQMKMVYELLKRRFMYENKDKIDEVSINYCGMPVCFGWKEFAIVTGLKWYPSSQFIPILTQKKAPHTPTKGKGKMCDRDDLVSIVGPSFKNKNLIEALKVKELSKKHKQSLCLVWFVHNILWARYVNNNISVGLIRISEDLEAFNSYLWGYKSFKMTIQYLLTPLAPKIVNLYGFPWALMGELAVVDVLSSDVAVGGGSSVIVGANDDPLIVFKINHYEYDHTGYTDFASPSEHSACKCQDCREKYDVVINAINALATYAKELISKRGFIPSMRILFPSTPLEIKAKRRWKVIFKALSSI
ncbi:hypothetical protein BC332_24331 [Capsicum chinense]|nr:hypothetical protein BC332_24331 [Capsicum chinense]